MPRARFVAVLVSLVVSIALGGCGGGSSPAPTAPSAPTALVALGGPGEVGLTWAAPSATGGSAITDYRIYRRTASEGLTPVGYVGGTVRTYTDTGLTNGTEYFYAVAALNTVGEGVKSDEDSATPLAAPAAPTALVAVVGAGEVGLAWTAPVADAGTPVTDYQVYRGVTSGSLDPLAYVGGTDTTFVDDTVEPGTTYVYAVAAVNAVGEGDASEEASATAVLMILATVPVPAGTFTMGATDAEGGYSNEFPRHAVTLSSYDIGKFEVTNGEYAAILNWALAKGYLKNSGGDPYAGGDVYAGGQMLLEIASLYCQIAFGDGVFTTEVRNGLPMAEHPVVMVSWYGAAAFCTWLSESNGMSPWYDLTTWGWTASPDGYRLATEAEWERAAAWDVVAEPAKAWTYGFGADSIDTTRCNYYATTFANPLGLLGYPYTSPVGYYDGVISGTVDSQSPAGCYDMSGNVYEWCHDWYSGYAATPQEDPTGLGTGSIRVLRGGSWGSDAAFCRAPYRNYLDPTGRHYSIGLRVVLSPSRGE